MVSGKKVVATIEARMGSSRLPGKVLMQACGKPLLAHMIERLKRVPEIDEVVIATTANDSDQKIVDLAMSLGAGFFRGSEEDVLLRVLDAARSHKADIIVEFTGDCPAIDPGVVSRCIKAYSKTGVDYVVNDKNTYPGGMNTQVFSVKVLSEVEAITRGDKNAREHVSLAIRENPSRYKAHIVEALPEHRNPEIAIELDEAADYKMIKTIFEDLYPDKPDFDLNDILRYLSMNAHVAEMNSKVKRKKARE